MWQRGNSGSYDYFKYSIMRYQAIVSYDGFAYGGWQKQTNTNSIQEEIENVLLKINGYDTPITASGRTDAQVHAKGQVFHFDSDRILDDFHFTRAMNSLLPSDIRIQHVYQTSDDFHARFDAFGKRYDYLVTNDIKNPFYERYMGKEWKTLDISMMQECAQVFLGEHDFTSFTSNKIDPRKPRVKTIRKLEVIAHQDHIQMIFIGTGFLRYMVRMIAQTLIEAGKHRITKQQIQDMLNAKDKHACRYKADPQGLYLIEVFYNEEDYLKG